MSSFPVIVKVYLDGANSQAKLNSCAHSWTRALHIQSGASAPSKAIARRAVCRENYEAVGVCLPRRLRSRGHLIAERDGRGEEGQGEGGEAGTTATHDFNLRDEETFRWNIWWKEAGNERCLKYVW